MATKRTDIHRPGAIIPADYEYVMSYNDTTSHSGWPIPSLGFDCTKDHIGKKHSKNGLCCIVGMNNIAKVKWASTGSTCQCSVCSTHFIYGDVWKHIPTGEYIHVGHNCANKYSLLADRNIWEMEHMKAKKQAAIELKKRENAEKREKFLNEHPGFEEALETDHYIIQDIKSKFKTYCNLSEKQVALVHKIARDLKEKKMSPEPDPTIPAPEGRMEVEGEILGFKEVPGYMDSTVTKMIVRLGKGFDGAKVYCSKPSSYDKIQRGLVRGDVILFKATFQRSDNDQFFSFGKRPQLIQLIKSGEK